MIIRQATIADIASVRNLVQELADYENEPDALTASLTHYQEQYKAGLYDVIVAEVAGEIIGMALYYLRFSTWKGKMMHLEDFYVQEAHRRDGTGKMIFDAFLAESKSQGCVMVIWQVLDWNQIAINFYDKYQAEYDKGWWNCKLYF